MTLRPVRFSTIAHVLAVSVITLLVLELVARGLVANAPEDVRWYDEAAQLKITQMDSLDQTDVVFVGTSMAWQAFDPEAFSAADPLSRSSYNAGLNGGVPGVMAPWLLDEVVPRLQPTTVVWGLGSLDITESYGDANVEAYETAPESASSWLAVLDRFASSNAVLVRERRLLRNPSRLIGSEATEAELAWDRARSTLGPGGQRRDFDVRVDATTEAIERSRLAEFEFSVDDVSTILQTIDKLKQAGIEVTLVALPVPDRYAALHPNGRADVQSVAKIVHEIGSHAGVPVIDLHDAEPDKAFVDFTHLSEAAASRFSATFARILGNTGPAATDRGRFLDAASTLTRQLELWTDVMEQRPVSGQQSTSFFFNAEDYGRAATLLDLVETGTDIQTVLIGTSQMRNAGDSTSITSMTGATTVNLALSGAGPEVWDRYLPDRILPVANPERIVWGVGVLDLAGDANACTLFRGRRDTLDRALLAASQAFPWTEDNQLGTIEVLTHAPPNGLHPARKYYDLWFGDLGDQVLNTDRNYASDAVDYPPASADYDICSTRFELVLQTVRTYAEVGVDVLVVSMPTPQFRLDVYRGDGSDIDAHLAGFGALVRSAGGRYVDLTRVLPDEQFRDYSHVNADGAAEFSRLLADLLRP